MGNDLIDEMFRLRARDERARDALREWLDQMCGDGLIRTEGLQQRHLAAGAAQIANAVEAADA